MSFSELTPYNPTFSANGSMTWDVDPGDIVSLRAHRDGGLLLVQFNLVSTSVAGLPDSQLRIGLPDGLVCDGNYDGVFRNSDKGAPFEYGNIVSVDGEAFIRLYKQGFTPWCVPSTNLTHVAGQILIGVQ